MKILLVEDDDSTANYIEVGLSEHGHSVDRVSDGHSGLIQILGAHYDVVIIDRMLPQLDGLSLVRAARQSGAKVPVIFLSALSGVYDRVAGLDAGGDDYLVKPFSMSELHARVQAIGRRPPTAETVTELRVGDLSLSLLSRTASRNGQVIELQAREFQLLEYLMRNPDRVVTKTMLLEHVWDIHFDPRSSVVETLISRLRSKVDRGFSHEMIKTVRGSGYLISASR